MNTMMNWGRRTVACLLLGLAACGGGGGGVGTPSPSSTTATIDGSGGTVALASGAQVVVPAGALAQATPIAVTQTAEGAPPLPTGTTVIGPMFAFTPHGSAFAAPVTISVPFDAGAVPVGQTPQLFKTVAGQTAWQAVTGAVVAGDRMTAQVSSFSFVTVVLPPVVRLAPRRFTTFVPYAGGDAVVKPEAPDGEMHETFPDHPEPAFLDLNRDGRATLETFSSADGVTFWASAEDIGKAKLVQRQSFIKRSPSATLRFVISSALLEAVDFNGALLPNECAESTLPPDPNSLLVRCRNLSGSIHYTTVAYDAGGNLLMKRDGTPVLNAGSYAILVGRSGIWDLAIDRQSAPQSVEFDRETNALVLPTPFTDVWTAANFSVTKDVDGDAGQFHPQLKLNGALILELDLSDVPKDSTFSVVTVIEADAFTSRRRESGFAAFLRDPVEIGGTTVQFTGLEPTTAPLPQGPGPIDSPVPCTTGPDPDAGQLQFSAARYTVLERPHAALMSGGIVVTRAQGSKGAVSATFTAGGGTAVPDVHYTPMSFNVTFADGDTRPRHIDLDIVPNTLAESDKTVDLTLSQPGGCATLGAQSRAIVTILDDDQPTGGTAFTLGGTVTGLAGSGLTLTDLGEDLGVAINGSFVFAQPLADGLPYTVSVKTQPTNPSQVCSVSNPSGTVRGANIVNVTVTCVTPPPNGSLDATFGSGGTVFSAQMAMSDASSALARQADGKFVVVGRSFAAMRFNADGSVDTGFGTAGKAIATFGAGTTDEARGVAVQADGRIVVVGHSRTGVSASGRDFALARFQPDGSLDTNFGTAGLVRTDFNAELDEAHTVAIQADGKIIVAGNSVTSVTTPSTFALARYNVDGSLDTTFGSGGKATVDVSGGTSLGRSVAVQPDGRIVVAGKATRANSVVLDQTGVARFDATGQLDAGFGTGGKALVDLLGGDQVLLQADGRLLLPGTVAPTPFTPRDFALVRLNTDGRLDTGFGSSGIASIDFGGTEDTARAAAVQADGRIVVAGSRFDPLVPFSAGIDFALARFDATGGIDVGFGTAGRLTLDFFGGPDSATSVLVQPDGRIVVAGPARNGNASGIGLARVQP